MNRTTPRSYWITVPVFFGLFFGGGGGGAYLCARVGPQLGAGGIRRLPRLPLGFCHKHLSLGWCFASCRRAKTHAFDSFERTSLSLRGETSCSYGSSRLICFCSGGIDHLHSFWRGHGHFVNRFGLRLGTLLVRRAWPWIWRYLLEACSSRLLGVPQGRLAGVHFLSYGPTDHSSGPLSAAAELKRQATWEGIEMRNNLDGSPVRSHLINGHKLSKDRRFA